MTNYSHHKQPIPKILIVDDQEKNLIALKKVLTNLKVKILTATSGNEALTLVLRHEFVVILLDVQMPVMDGFEVARLLKLNDASKIIPIIFITALDREKKQVFKGYHLGAVDYIFKPVEPIILRGKVGVFLDLYNQKKELENSKKELEKLTEKLSQNIEELKNAQSQLVQSEKMASLGQLTAGIAHEINNPINFVYAGSNALNKNYGSFKKILEKYEVLKPGDPKLISKLKEIESLKKKYAFKDSYEAIPQLIDDVLIGAKRIAEIVAGLRNFSRLDEAEIKTVNIHVGIESTLLLLHGKYKDKVIIHKHYDHKAGQIECYPGQLNQVFMNLLNNAIDAIDNKGEISITTKKLKDKIKISIKDNGMGIKPEIQKKMFEPFFTTKEVGAGVGLGLSICFGIIERHKGKIEVKSQVGRGSEFIITLPQNKML